MLILSSQLKPHEETATTPPRPEHTEGLMTIHNRQTPDTTSSHDSETETIRFLNFWTTFHPCGGGGGGGGVSLALWKDSLGTTGSALTYMYMYAMMVIVTTSSSSMQAESFLRCDIQLTQNVSSRSRIGE